MNKLLIILKVVWDMLRTKDVENYEPGQIIDGKLVESHKYSFQGKRFSLEKKVKALCDSDIIDVHTSIELLNRLNGCDNFSELKEIEKRVNGYACNSN